MTGLFIFSGCAPRSFQQIRDAIPVQEEKILLSADSNSGSNLYVYGSSGLIKWMNGNGIGSFPSHVEKLYRYEDIFAALTGDKGIYLFSEKTNNSAHIAPGPQGLGDYRIRDVYIYSLTDQLKLYVTYYTPEGVGVTECTVPNNLEYSCKTYNSSNSELKSNYVHQVISDIKGNIWFRYSNAVSIGVSRLSQDGAWNHFDKRNSNIGDNSVLLIRCENNNGLGGNSVWFVTQAGLSRLQYSENKEDWFFYGDKRTFTNEIIQAIGIQQWFTDAIIDIVDLAILPDSLMIANKYALYKYTNKNIERFLPDTTGGREDLRIDQIVNIRNNIFVKIKPHVDAKPAVKYLMVFQLDKRQWQQIKYWQMEKSYAEDILILPYNSEKDILVFKYPSGNTKVAYLLYQDFSLHEIKIDLTDK